MAQGPRQKQMGVSLTEELRAQLSAASTARGHSIAEEIRQRLERTFAEDALDPVLRTFVADLIAVAELVRVDTGGGWSSDPASHAAFKAAVLALLTEHQPNGPPIFGAVRDLLGTNVLGSDDPETVGRTLARYHRRHQTSKGEKP
jgi:hypothetical protein